MLNGRKHLLPTLPHCSILHNGLVENFSLKTFGGENSRMFNEALVKF